MPTWDPATYLQFSEERSRPFFELTARIATTDPRYVVDLGCGPGPLTATLLQRWPTAKVVGVDSSPEMIEAAQPLTSERLSFRLADVMTWRPPQPVDVVVSSATLQWVPQHRDLLPRLLDLLNPAGWLAFQVPGNFD
ncbi:MAG TPA: methyltransferase domain-containing protein, partial [Pseudonocardiaceae bacterium]|nr:methyltransferase domain-containing protein [Pseudonocardiaceae bacterium]